MYEEFESRTDFLFTSPSFFIGIGSIFNIAGNYYDYNTSESEIQADIRALKSDWNMIKKDFEEAKKTFMKKYNHNQLGLEL